MSTTPPDGKEPPGLKKVEIQTSELVPDGQLCEEYDVWLACYRVFKVGRGEIAGEKVPRVDIGRCRLTFVYGSIRYLRAPALSLSPWQLEGPLVATTQGKVENRETPLGAYVLVGTPFPVEPELMDERDARDRVDHAVTLARLFLGRNAAFDEVFQQIAMPKGGFKAFTPSIESPLAFPIPEISDEALEDLHEIGSQVAGLEAVDAHRIHLAIRWESAAISSVGVDSFIRHWIALETLMMPDTTNIKPIEAALSEIYGLHLADVRGRFLIGKIFGVRSLIVHQGSRPPVYLINGYLEALFVDCLRHVLKLPSQKRVGQLLSDTYELETKLSKMLDEG